MRCLPVLVLLLLPATLSAATFTVTNLNDSGAGSLRQAITDAQAATGTDVIQFQTGLSGTISTASALPGIFTSLIIQGNNEVAISGAGSGSRIFSVASTGSSIDISLRNLTMADGSAIGGAGIAVAANAGDVDFELVECTVRNCIADIGAGLFLTASSGMTITATLERCTFTQNSGAVVGSATYVENAVFLTATNCTFSGNGISSQCSMLHFAQTASCVLVHCTVTDNNCGASSALQQTSGSVSIGNCIVAGNTTTGASPDGAGAFTSLGGNVIGDATGMAITAQTGDQIGTTAAPIDPLLSPLAANGGATLTHRIDNASPAVDAGDWSLAPSDDQRGYTRVDQPDCGAVELQSPQIDVALGGSLTDGQVFFLVGAGTPGTGRDEVFTITNFAAAGEKNLTLQPTLPIAFGGFGNCTAAVTSPPQGTIAPLTATNFTLTITPTAQGLYWCEVVVLSDDPITPTFNVTLVGAADAPSSSGGGGGGGDGDDGSCSTGTGAASWLLLLGALATLSLAIRLLRRRGAKACTTAQA
ncbi:MAG: right-handed parallel beta-helix repeat-containing protein [Planctomycetes bacterium]|nr:right-handed parallel beta-helix repeat-containing protein [Planctomycetota bacterium]